MTYAVNGARERPSTTASARAGGTRPVRIPCHLTSFAGSQPCALRGASQWERRLAPVRLAHGHAAEREQAVLSDPAALVEEEKAHEPKLHGLTGP